MPQQRGHQWRSMPVLPQGLHARTSSSEDEMGIQLAEVAYCSDKNLDAPSTGCEGPEDQPPTSGAVRSSNLASRPSGRSPADLLEEDATARGLKARSGRSLRKLIITPRPLRQVIITIADHQLHTQCPRSDPSRLRIEPAGSAWHSLGAEVAESAPDVSDGHPRCGQHGSPTIRPTQQT